LLIEAVTYAGEHPGEELLKLMADAIEENIGEFTSQNMSNALLAFAKLEYYPERVLTVIAMTALSKLSTFTPQVGGLMQMGKRHIFLLSCSKGTFIFFMQRKKRSHPKQLRWLTETVPREGQHFRGRSGNAFIVESVPRELIR
jgi:hypothetical protein